MYLIREDNLGSLPNGGVPMKRSFKKYGGLLNAVDTDKVVPPTQFVKAVSGGDVIPKSNLF